MRLTNAPFQGVVAIRAGARQAVGRIGIRNLGVGPGVPILTRMTGIVVPTITSVTQAGNARARPLFGERQLEACVNVTCAFLKILSIS